MSSFLTDSNILIVLVVLAISLIVLFKSADFMVDNAVNLSHKIGIPEIIIGATIVSLGTTLPELSASVTSALNGNGSFALGNAVGSIITNTTLIIGIGALYGKIPVDKKSSQKLTILIVAVVLLILPTLPYKIPGGGGKIPQFMGYVFLILIPIYIFFLIYQEKKAGKTQEEIQEIQDKIQENGENKHKGNTLLYIVGIIVSAVLIALSASGLVSSAEILAIRIGIPNVVIASTLVAFGTSVPELSTCIAAARRNHGGLAIGNIMGANLLNIILVVGASVALTNGGMLIDQSFYSIHFLILVAVVTIFGFFAYNTKYNEIKRNEGLLLIGVYVVYLGANILSTF